MKRFWLMLLLCVFSAGCAPEVQQLQKQVRDLKADVSAREAENSRIQGELNSCTSLATTLKTERQERHKDLTSLKAETRAYIKAEFDTLRNFSKNSVLLDYMGGELIERKHKSGSNTTVLNLQKVDTDAVLYGVEGYFDPGSIVVPQLFRKKGEYMFCIWQGPLLEVVDSGVSFFDLDTPLNIQKGDYVGFYFPEKVAVSYDERTGNYVTFSGKIDLGEAVPSSFSTENRNYSVGVRGFIF